jgi:hypothetical protein
VEIEKEHEEFRRIGCPMRTALGRKPTQLGAGRPGAKDGGASAYNVAAYAFRNEKDPAFKWLDLRLHDPAWPT